MSESARMLAALRVEEWTLAPVLLTWLTGLATVAAFWIWDKSRT